LNPNLRALTAKLNPAVRNALENAAGLCLSRTHYNVEIEHLLTKLLDTVNNDASLMLKNAGVDTSRLAKDLTVSLDGMKEFHDHVRQVPGLWDNAIRTLRAIVDLTRRYSHLTIGVNTVFMRENQSDIEPLLHYIRDEVRPTFHALSFIRGKPVDGTLMHDLDVERYIELSRWIDDHYGSDVNWNSGWRGVRARARRMINRQRYEYIARQARGGAFESDCLAGEREYVMTETGNIHGCELINDRLGNVRDAHYDFATIRDSVAADAFVASRRARQCRCTHECNTRTMLLFRRRNAIPLVSAALGITKV